MSGSTGSSGSRIQVQGEMPHISSHVSMLATHKMAPRNLAIVLSAAVTTLARGQYALDPVWPLPFSFNVSRITAAAVVTTSEGVEIHVAQRGLEAPPVLVFDIAGRVTRTWGARNITSIHGLNAQQGNPDTIWVVDSGDFTVKQFDVNGTVLRGVGTPGHGGGGLAPVQFSSPADVSFTSAGSIAISDGDGGSNNRVLMLAGSDFSVEFSIGSNGTGVRWGGPSLTRHRPFDTPATPVACSRASSKARTASTWTSQPASSGSPTGATGASMPSGSPTACGWAPGARVRVCVCGGEAVISVPPPPLRP